MGNHHLKSERMALYGAMTQFLLNALPLPLTDDQSQQRLRASLPVGGRTITLYEAINQEEFHSTPTETPGCCSDEKEDT
ncbi:MAG: hypothetical protein EPN21_10140 [Methylococcaceae bacterium]|nr:MAG: hypothetical protein EPN21_10140 [Methylococcaceae bacterium]